MQWMKLDAGQTAFSIPSDGRGGKCTFRGATTAANTTHAVAAPLANPQGGRIGYGTWSVTDANGTPFNAAFAGNAAGAFANIAVGDLLVTADGFWATVASKTAPGTVTIRDIWRHATNPALDATTPAAATACAVFSPSILQGQRAERRPCVLERVIVHRAPISAVATFDVLAGDGATEIVPTTTLQGSAAVTTPLPIPLELEIPWRGPFGLVASATTVDLCIFFSNAD